MDLKSGYKQTELGVIPEDWNVRRLISIADVRDGTHDSPRYTQNGVPFITSKNISFGRIDFNDITFISEKDARQINKRSKVGCNDILLSMIGTVGNAALVVSEPNFCIKNVALIKPSLTIVDPRFLIQLLRSDRYSKYIESKLDGGIQKFISLGALRDLNAPLPPTKAEQEAIAGALSDADALIESLEQLLAKKRQIKKGAMRELLTGKKRLSGFTRKWEQVSLGELFTFKNGLNKAKRYFGYGTPIVNYMDVFKDPKIYCSRLEGRVSLTAHELRNFDIKKGDVLFTRTSETPDEIGMASVVLDEPSQTVFSGFVLRARPKDQRLCDQFKAYCFRSEHIRGQIVSKASYTTRALTNGRLLSAVYLPAPDVEEQTAIATILSDIDAEITALEAKLAKARQIKQGMMQELLTGRIRLV